MDHTHQKCGGYAFAGDITHDQRDSFVFKAEYIVEISTNLLGWGVLHCEMNTNIFLRQAWQEFGLDLTRNLELLFKVFAMSTPGCLRLPLAL